MSLFWIGALLVMAGSFLVYLASPNCSPTVSVAARRASGWGGVATMLAGQFMLLCWAGPATAIFIALTFASLVWSVVPLLALWLRMRREAGR
ncbi:hypothetical protein [Novosphingobium guangzhouense]|uniref:Uncharacterized protein n=1 Tax=Novosphingobium guangzhouense TaxID=1850347 RepID=A0A2K2FV84_9SPHN|nr:hypothetical protein [Novosphingobium guangzhouense]PNU02705.1 hypothetical protein A8V01_25890 [Novosphingobium guangzhouense]